ncbi:MAG: hypothetical protein SF051_14720 [Elusimicrobiota bacterium]|nr:hypothetical protein [Elusimicrobiota bacterium]
MSRPLALAALVAALSACGGAGAGRVPVEPEPPAHPGVSPAQANFQLVVNETVTDPAEEGASYTVVSVDGVVAGRTAPGARGAEKRLLLKLEPGNRPLRLEHWLLPPVGEWAPASADRQPRERFVRVEEGFVTRVFLRLPASGPAQLIVQREPKGTFKLEP